MAALEASHIAIVGDLHGSWDPFDADWFAASHYDLVLFVGDLAGGTLGRDIAIAKSIARLGKPCLVLPGNNDVEALPALEAELTLQEGLLNLMDEPPAARTRLCGYSSHALRAGPRNLTLIVGRPFAMGGSELSFPELLGRRHGVASMEQSTERLCSLVDGSESDELLFLAHNGPFGLGGEPADLWGNDFVEDGGDWGDRDIAEALHHARQRGKRVHAVIAGHMHRRVRGGGLRPFSRSRTGVQYINPAQVPRVVPTGEGSLHHHVSMTWHAGAPLFEERWIPSGDA